MLALEIELLTGAYRASLVDGSAAEWPPHPERVFSALAQSWGDGGCDAKERAALEWLECLPHPKIEADDDQDCGERSAPNVVVPPGDKAEAFFNPKLKKGFRNFRVVIPCKPIVKLIWPDSADELKHLPALESLACRVASLGHSASFVRLAFTERPEEDRSRQWKPDDDDGTAVRTMHEGRLRNLEHWLSNHERPKSGTSIRYRRPLAMYQPEATKSVFGGPADWFVFEDAGGSRPDLLAFAHVAKCVRMSLLKHSAQPPPEIVSGHTDDRGPTSRPHVAVLPLANLGWPHSTSDLLGFAVVLPREISHGERSSVLRAVSTFARLDEGEDACAELHLSSRLHWKVQRSPAPSRASLKPGRWCSPAISWASATPVLLDRFADRNDPVEEAQSIAVACRNIGLPEPTAIEIHKHSAVRGTPSAYPPGGSRSGLDWSFPTDAKFARRPRRHVVVHFREAVQGPVILGAGRFYGLGLCLPLDQEK